MCYSNCSSCDAIDATQHIHTMADKNAQERSSWFPLGDHLTLAMLVLRRCSLISASMALQTHIVAKRSTTLAKKLYGPLQLMVPWSSR